MAWVDLFMQTEMSTKVNGEMTKLMAKEPTLTWTVLNTQATGKKTSNMAME